MPARASRRTTIAGGLAALLAVAGCDAVPSPREASPSGEPAGGSAPTATAQDRALVGEAASLVAGALAVLDQLDPALREAAAPLRDMHLIHLEVLAPEGSSAAATPAPPRQAQSAWDLVRRTERDLGRWLADSAVAADSGALARLLAVMSASVVQHHAGLPEVAPAGGAA